MNCSDLIAAIKLMGKGMAAIFIVMAAVAEIVYLLTKNKGGFEDEISDNVSEV